MALDGAHPIGEPGHNTDHEAIDRFISAMPAPARVVSADQDGITLVLDPTRAPSTIGADEVLVVDETRVPLAPTPLPAATQVVTVGPSGFSTTPLSGIAAQPGASTTVASTARRVIASAAGARAGAAFAVATDAPTVTVTAGSTSTIPSAVRVGLKRKAVGSTTFDVRSDPHFDFPGARTDTLTLLGTANGARAAYLTGGTSQNRRDYWRERTVFAGPRIDFHVIPATGTLAYRVWVDGAPLTLDQQKVTVTAASNQIISVDFSATTNPTGPRVVELEVNDPWLAGVSIGPTDTLERWKTPRPTLLGFGDSHTAGANGVAVGDTWLTWAARQLGMDPINMGIGGSGFLQAAGGGTTAPNFRARITPDVTSMTPDVVVFLGGYNDVSVSTAAAIQTEATLAYQQLVAENPNSVIIPTGPFQQSQAIGASMKAQDDAQRAAAVAAGLGANYVSFVDPLNLYGSTADWTASTAYVLGDTVRSANAVWKCVSAHTSGATFATDQPTRWRATSFNTGTGKSTALAGNGNADVNISSDGIHSTAQGHRNLALFLASEIARVLRTVAA
jgi:lysophospholipase L1-like esterase